MRVSVVVATKNAERTLERCLRSVRSQNFDDLEIVVVDNHSTDETLAVASSLADVVLTGGPERSAQRNSGAFVASGDALMFVDADMVLEPGVVRDAVGRLDGTDAAAVVIPERSFGDGFWARCKALEKQLALNDPAVEAARVFRRADFQAVRGYDESLVACEDWDLADRITARSGADPERTGALIWHDEGRLQLGTTFRKKRYYGRWVSAWLDTAPEHRRRRSFAAGVPQLLRHPVTGAGLVVMKVVEAVGFLLGIRDARRTGDGSGASESTDRAERRGVVAAGAVAAIVAAVMVQSWFSAGAFVASGDNGPWMRNLNGVTRAWSDSLVGTGSTGYPSASLIESFLHDAFGAIGISDTLGQRIWYSLVLAACAGSVAFLTAAFTRRPAAVASAALVAVLAPFHITTLPNILPLTAITALALILGAVARVATGRPLRSAIAAPIAVWVSPLAKNPPLLAIVAVIAVVAVVVGIVRSTGPTGPTARRFAAFAGWFAVASLFWVVPLVVHYLLGTPGLTIVAETDVDAWSWTQRHSGPGNVVTLVASWVWGDPDILPATATLARAPWSFLRWGLPIAALASIPLAVHRRTAATLAVIGAVLVVLCVGLNAPFGSLNRFLLDRVPGFWLFRQPMSKFGVVLVLVYALLVGLGVDGLLRRLPSWRPAAARTARAGAAVLAIAVVAFAHPLYTGSVIPGQRGGPDSLPPARVEVPQSWYDAGAWLDRAPLPGSVLVLPLSEYYQRGTTWGYYGVDDLLWRITDRRALYLLPGGYYEPAGSSPELMTALQEAVASGDGVATTRLMAALGVDYLAVRTDYRTTKGRTFADGRELVVAADADASLRRERTFEHVHIYSAAARSTGDAALVDVAAGTSTERLADVIATAPDGAGTVGDDGRPGSAVSWRPEAGESKHVFPNVDGRYLVSARPRSTPVWEARRFRQGRTSGVEVSLASTVSVDGQPVTDAAPVELTSSSTPVALQVRDQLVRLGDEPVLFEAEAGTALRLLGDGPATVPDGAEPVGNCNNTRSIGLAEAGITAERSDGELTLTAASGSACVTVPVASTPSPLGPPIWHVTASYERDAGVATRVCLWLPAVRKCAVGTPPGTAESTGTLDFLAAPATGERTEGAGLVLYADHQDGVDPVPAVTRYSRVSVAPLQSLGATVRLPGVGTVGSVRDLVAGETVFDVPPDLTRDLLRPIGEDVADCHDYDDSAAGLSATFSGDGATRTIELRARRHSACVDGDVAVPDGLRHLSVSFQHRSIQGRGGRWCLMGTDGTCAAGGLLPESPSWTQFTADVVLAARDPFRRAATDHLRLYLYADGAGPGISAGADTVVGYRSVTVRPTYPMVAVAQPVRRGVAAATRVDDRHASVRGADTAVFRLAEAYGAGWSLDGLPEGASARHVVVDGWANGWVVEGLRGRPVVASFRYGPDTWVSLAVWSILPVLAAAVVALAAPVIVRRRRRARPASRFAATHERFA